MKLLKLMCPNCNSILEVNEEMKQFTCNYCGTTSLLDDEIIKVKNVVSFLDTYLSNLKDYYDNGNYEKCYFTSKELLDDYPKNNDLRLYIKMSGIKLVESFIQNKDFEKSMDCVVDLIQFDNMKEDKEIIDCFGDCCINYLKTLKNNSFSNYDDYEKFKLIAEGVIVYNSDKAKTYCKKYALVHLKELCEGLKEAFDNQDFKYINDNLNGYKEKSKEIIELFSNDNKDIIELISDCDKYINSKKNNWF